MFRALCAHHQEVKILYTASGIITPVGGRPVHRLRVFSQPVHLLMMSTKCSKHVQTFNKSIIKRDFIHQVD